MMMTTVRDRSFGQRAFPRASGSPSALVVLGKNVKVEAGVVVGNNVTVADGITVSSNVPDGTTLP